MPRIGDKEQIYLFLIVSHPLFYLLIASSSSLCPFQGSPGFGTHRELFHGSGGFAAETCHPIIAGNSIHFAVGSLIPALPPALPFLLQNRANMRLF